MQAYQISQNKLNKKYSKIPCDECKDHHIKCDKILDGCKNCSRRGINCTYLIARKRRGPKTKSESMIKLLESLNITNKSSTGVENTNNQNILSISVDNRTSQVLGLQLLAVSLQMQVTPAFSNNFTMLQTTPIDLSAVYQDIYSLHTLVMSSYNRPLPPLTNEISFTNPTPCDYLNLFPHIGQFQQIESLSQVSHYYNTQNYTT